MVTARVWRRYTGEPLAYTNFHPEDGRDAGQHCATNARDRNHMWADVECAKKRSFMCEIDIY